MITAVRGRVFDLLPGRVCVETPGGVVLELACPVSDYPELKKRGEVLMYTVLRMKDDQVYLYGFLHAATRRLFEKLISISGVGGKTALSFISAFSCHELTAAIEAGDAVKLSSIPGVGKKTAQLIILKLTGKLEVEAREKDEEEMKEGGLKKDLVSALENLGYAPRRVVKIVERAVGKDADEPFEAAFKKVMKEIRRG